MRASIVPISPELCLVDPELAAWARAQLPDPVLDEQPVAEPRAPDPLLRPPRPAPPPARLSLPPRPRRSRRPVATALVACVIVAGGAALFPAAAEQRLSPVALHAPVEAQPLPLLAVPDACGDSYVFAKEVLEETGFGWRIAGTGHGYASDIVVGERPPPGTRVFDTGAPTIELVLAPDPRYTETGSPDPAAPYPGTELRVAAPARVAGGCAG
jgi:hypothetical protein